MVKNILLYLFMSISSLILAASFSLIYIPKYIVMDDTGNLMIKILVIILVAYLLFILLDGIKNYLVGKIFKQLTHLFMSTMMLVSLVFTVFFTQFSIVETTYQMNYGKYYYLKNNSLSTVRVYFSEIKSDQEEDCLYWNTSEDYKCIYPGLYFNLTKQDPPYYQLDKLEEDYYIDLKPYDVIFIKPENSFHLKYQGNISIIPTYNSFI